MGCGCKNKSKDFQQQVAQQKLVQQNLNTNLVSSTPKSSSAPQIPNQNTATRSIPPPIIAQTPTQPLSPRAQRIQARAERIARRQRRWRIREIRRVRAENLAKQNKQSDN